MKNLLKLSLIPCFALSFAHSAQEEMTKIEDKNLDSIVSTSTRIPTLITEAPGNVSVIDSQNIKTQTSNQMSDILSKMASVRLDKETGYNGRPQIFVRGIPYGTLIMLDGVILNDLEGEIRILQSINPYDIDHIEVVRGAFSSLYGTGGVGGVINFITKMPKKLEGRAILGYGNEMVRNGAEKNLVRGYVSLGDVFLDGRLRMRVSYGFNSSDGAYRVPAFAKNTSGVNGVTFQDGTALSDGAMVGWIGRTAYLTQDARARLEYDWDDKQTTSLNLTLSTISENQHDPISYIKDSNGTVYAYENTSKGKGYYNPFIGTGWGGFRSEYNYVISASHKYYFNDQSYLQATLSSVNLANRWNDGCTGANCSGNGKDPTEEGKNSYVFGGRGTSSDNYASSNYLDIIYSGQINSKHNLLAGVQGRLMFARNERHYSSNFSASDFWNYYDGIWGKDTSAAYTIAGFVSWQARWCEHFSTNLGLRLDYWQNFDMSTFDLTATDSSLQTFKGAQKFFPSPKFAINYNPWKYTTIKSSIGLAFRAPNTRQMFAHAHDGDVQISNTQLSPEYGLQFDIGVEQRNPYGGVVKVYYFQTEMYDAIYKSGGGSFENPFVYENGGRSRFNGIELEVEQKIYKDLSISGNYTYTRAILLKDPQNSQYDGNQMASIPRHMGMLALNYGGTKGLYASLQMQGNSGAFMSIENKPIVFGFGNVTKRLIFNFKIGYEFKNQTHLSVSFLNFTNTKYWDYYRGSGASFFVELGTKFL